MKLRAQPLVGQPVLDFITDVADIVQQDLGEKETTDRVRGRLSQAIAQGFALPEAVKEPNPEHYVMYPIFVARDASFCVASAVWGIGQQTPVHDHGVWGVVGILDGVEREEAFRHGQPSAPLVHRSTTDLAAGQVIVCCTTDQDLHRVSAVGQCPCVGIHVYGGDIGTIRRRSYDVDTSDISWFTSAWGGDAIVEDVA